jgi:L,D-peptidoglycan transpeptidase YkuD (ErfK/YbiS/YcfS/YnhG family)
MARLKGCKVVLMLGLLALASRSALAQSCPEPLASARRLVLVTSDTMKTSLARLQRFERASPDGPWRPVGGPQSALVGKRGMAWASTFRAFAQNGEPIKVEGDRRAPAGFYRIGASFGFAAPRRPGYLQIKDDTVCVDDLASPAYNAITSRAKVGAAHGENMRRVQAYRNGLVVEYPTDRAARAGSCIFIHVRLPSMTGTSGCVAVPEPQVIALQDFAAPGAVLAVLPEAARGRFGGCLPAAN